MNISKALKEKNRLTGKIAQLQKKVMTYNVKNEGEPSDFDSLEVLKELQFAWAYLIDLKTKIAKANIGIADKLIELTEAKAELTFWNSFNNAGPAKTIVKSNKFNGRETVEVETVRLSGITSKEVFDYRDSVQERIDALQDEIDIFNGSTMI